MATVGFVGDRPFLAFSDVAGSARFGIQQERIRDDYSRNRLRFMHRAGEFL